jgi:hypothetical protein
MPVREHDAVSTGSDRLAQEIARADRALGQAPLGDARGLDEPAADVEEDDPELLALCVGDVAEELVDPARVTIPPAATTSSCRTPRRRGRRRHVPSGVDRGGTCRAMRARACAAARSAAANSLPQPAAPAGPQTRGGAGTNAANARARRSARRAPAAATLLRARGGVAGCACAFRERCEAALAVHRAATTRRRTSRAEPRDAGGDQGRGGASRALTCARASCGPSAGARCPSFRGRGASPGGALERPRRLVACVRARTVRNLSAEPGRRRRRGVERGGCMRISASCS